MITREDGAVFAAELAKFKAEHRDIAGQVGVWVDLAMAAFVDYLSEIREDITAEERAKGLPIVAALAITETAAKWQKACCKRTA